MVQCVYVEAIPRTDSHRLNLSSRVEASFLEGVNNSSFQASSCDSSMIGSSLGMLLKRKNTGSMLLLLRVLWWLWRYRNSVTFSSQPLRKSDLFDNVRFSSFSWLHNRDHMKLSWNDWLMYPHFDHGIMAMVRLLWFFPEAGVQVRWVRRTCNAKQLSLQGDLADPFIRRFINFSLQGELTALQFKANKQVLCTGRINSSSVQGELTSSLYKVIYQFLFARRFNKIPSQGDLSSFFARRINNFPLQGDLTILL
ncbi:hypothetical protein Tco_0493067 [Tanacetum coccineum]